MKWEDAIWSVLSQATKPMTSVEIADKIVEDELRGKVGATPAATVASVLSTSIKTGQSRFVRLGRGEYAAKGRLEEINEKTKSSDQAANDLSDTEESGALRAFGVFWKRADVVWKSNGRLLGQQSRKSEPVDHASQIGIYILYDRARPIYVGKAEVAIYSRLFMHTQNRLSGRWDRFSWFGLRPVDGDGNLSDPVAEWTSDKIVETLEAVLIEGLEPPLNRRRGDNLESLEYQQVTDPTIKSSQVESIRKDLMKKLTST